MQLDKERSFTAVTSARCVAVWTQWSLALKSGFGTHVLISIRGKKKKKELKL